MGWAGPSPYELERVDPGEEGRSEAGGREIEKRAKIERSTTKKRRERRQKVASMGMKKGKGRTRKEEMEGGRRSEWQQGNSLQRVKKEPLWEKSKAPRSQPIYILVKIGWGAHI